MGEPKSEGLLSQDDINAALAAAGLAGQSGGAGSAPAVDDDFSASGAPTGTAVSDAAAHPFQIPELSSPLADGSGAQGIELLRDVELNVKIELGRSRMLVEDVLRLSEGAVVELDKLAGDPVDVFVNNRLVARGEVLVLNDNFCVRINEIVCRDGEEAAV